MTSINNPCKDGLDKNSQNPFTLERQNFVVVDDEPEIISILEDFLNNLGFDRRTACNGLEALELLKEEPATIIITDIIMPEMDGMELIYVVKENWPETDIIVMTGYANEFKYTDVIKAGASDFIQKPFNLNELEAKIDRIIRERSLKTTLKKLAINDALTGLYNRHAFEEKVEAEAERSVRMQYSLFLIMMDLDKLKMVNDTMGHQMGDYILKTLANVILFSTRKNVDSAFRLGGDEFAILLPSSHAFHVEELAERIRINYFKSDNHGTSLSLGVSRFINRHNDLREDIYAFIKTADSALYEAKKSGGNKVVLDASAK